MMYMREGDPETANEPWLNITWGLAALFDGDRQPCAQFLFCMGQRGGG